MNPVTHLLFSITVMLLGFYPEVSMLEIVIFSLVFSVFLDMDMLIAKVIYRPYDRLRTWIQEPAGFFIIGVPVGLVLSTLQQYYLYLTLVPYALHIVLDYMSTYTVSPLAPFDPYKVDRRGFAFSLWPAPVWQDEDEGVPELFLIVVLALSLAYTWFNII
ncbi:MAG: hypothetical protein SVU32_09485 [Candidatus Nanohaloarchaea archaeon]|nr:hypothetical protein [Candidatus Nanohaloarchaea archaeon]